MSIVCEHCNISRATQHCNVCRQGFTCHEKTCAVSFEYSHICNKTKRERVEEEEPSGSPELLHNLMFRYKDIMQNFLSHLDRWEDVKHICNTNTVMRQACADFRQLSGGIWQFLMKLYFPLKNFKPSILRLRDGEWPVWARQNPYIYFRALILAIFLKYGTLSDYNDRYQNNADKILQLSRGEYHVPRPFSTIALRKDELENTEMNVIPDIWDHEADEEESRSSYDNEPFENPRHRWWYMKLLFEHGTRNHLPLPLDQEFEKIHTGTALGWEKYAALTQMIDENGDRVDVDKDTLVSVAKLAKFFFRVWSVHGYSWENFADIPK